MKKIKEVQAVTTAEDLGAVGEGIPQSAMPTAPFDKGANEGAAEGDGAEILCGAQDDESLVQGEGDGTVKTVPYEQPINEAKVKLIVNKSMVVPEVKDGRVQLRAAYGGTVYSGSRREFGTGVFAELPVGYIGFIVPEKRLKENSGLLCTDIRYAWEEGEISVTLHNVGIRNCDIQPGQLIAEMIIVPVLDAEV